VVPFLYGKKVGRTVFAAHRSSQKRAHHWQFTRIRPSKVEGKDKCVDKARNNRYYTVKVGQKVL
jgi:hypothetical protein